jgi:hypothetical protein
VIINEVSFYETFSEAFSKYLKAYLGEGYRVYYSCNKTLDIIVADLEVLSSNPIKEEGTYIPKLKVDIVFGVFNQDQFLKLILIEAKYLSQLSLKDYSQLVGYLQVAKTIDVGLLLLIQKGMSINKMSNDLQEIVRLRKLPMDWFMNLKATSEQYNFKTGIIHFMSAGVIDWVDTTDIQGISSFKDLIDALKS